MSASIDTTVAELFEQLAPAKKARSRWDREAELIHRHTAVARRYAAAFFLKLLSAPEFVDRTISEEEIGDRLEGALDDLIEQAAAVCRRGGYDKVTSLQGQVRLVVGFSECIEQLAAAGRTRGHA